MTCLLAISLVACGQNATDDDGDNGGQPGNGAGTEYTDVFFKTVEENGPHNVIVGTTELTLSSGQITGTLTAYPDSDFPNDTGTLSGSYQEGPVQGDKQSYTADLTLDFSSAPDYAASGRVYTVAGKIFTEESIVLSKDGTRVGNLSLRRKTTKTTTNR